jgi:antitoxin component YwqK of YwqJK toxin-antitoxin module
MTTQRNILDVNEIRDTRGRIHSEFPAHGNGGVRPHGTFCALRKDGNLLLEISYREGVVHGRYCDYWPNGQLACSGDFQDGKQHGIWHFFREDGTLFETILFEDGREVPLRGVNGPTRPGQVSGPD